MNENFVSDFVFGGIDGIITTFAIVSGTAGANLPYTIIIILGLSNVLADGFSMAASRYLSAETEEEIWMKEKGVLRYPSPLLSAIIVFLAFVGMGMIPLLAFIIGHLLSKGKQMYNYSYVFTAFALFLVGYLKGLSLDDSLTGGSSPPTGGSSPPIDSGLETLTVGGVASLIAFFVGRALQQIH